MNGPLRCDEVMRELAAPTAGADAAGLGAHLAACPRCARFAEDAARLDRLWDATRPAGPPDETWDHVWAAVCERLDGAAVETPEPAPDLIPFPATGPVRVNWWRRGVWAFCVAQAAGLLIGFGLLLSRNPAPEPAASLVNFQVEIEQGEVVTIYDDGQVDRRDAFTDLESAPNTLDDNYAMLNALEAMAKAKDL